MGQTGICMAHSRRSSLESFGSNKHQTQLGLRLVILNAIDWLSESPEECRSIRVFGGKAFKIGAVKALSKRVEETVWTQPATSSAGGSRRGHRARTRQSRFA